MRSSGVPFALPMIALSVAFFGVPLVLLGVFSLRTDAGEHVFANYGAILGDQFTVEVLLETLRLGAYVVAGTTLLGVPIALCFWHAGTRLRAAIVFMVLLPMLTSNVVRTFAWIVILGRQGPVSQALMDFGLMSTPTSFLFTELGVVAALCQIELPLLVLPMIAVLSRIDRQIMQAAEMSGAGRWRILLTMILPLSAPGLFAGWILVFASATTSFVTQTVIGGARHIYLPQLIYRQVNVIFDWPSAAAAAFVLLLSSGTVMLALAMMSRHRRLIAHA
jgi:putative spermidine/putrescine transport system permease protein